MDKRNQVSMWTAGLNWYALPNLVVKADYLTRQIGTGKVFGKGKYNSENEFSIGIAYVGGFWRDRCRREKTKRSRNLDSSQFRGKTES